MDSKTISKTNNSIPPTQDSSSNKLLDKIHVVMLEELCALRRDVDSIGHGGWSVNIGPFQHAEGRGKATNAFKDRVLEKLGIVLGDSPLTSPMTPHGDCQKPDNSNLLSELKGFKVLDITQHDTSAIQVPEPEVQNAPLCRPKANSPDHTLRADSPIDSIEDPARSIIRTWQPSFLRNLAPLQGLQIPLPAKMTTFTWDFLQATFQGIEWSPGFYYKPKSAGGCLLPTRTYYAIDATYDPYLPAEPGAHGAKLVPFFNNVDISEDNAVYDNVPLFISAAKYGNSRFKNNQYIYFGLYSQSRWSDKLDYDHIREHVPDDVKYYWAEQLSDPARPDWVTKALMKHLIPPPEYEGVLPTSNASDVTADGRDIGKQMDRDVRKFIRGLKSWEKDASLKVRLLKKENVLEAFKNADADEDPGLRLWWEYLECVGWDDKFYDMLVGLQAKSKR